MCGNIDSANLQYNGLSVSFKAVLRKTLAFEDILFIFRILIGIPEGFSDNAAY